MADLIEVCGVADHDMAKADVLAKRFGCAAVRDCTALLEQVRPDAVVIATPPAEHAQDIVRCLDRGVDVLCEKPLTTDLQGLATIEAALLRSTATLAMASKYRHARDVMRARALLAGGAIGRLQELEVGFARRIDMSNRWYSDRPVSGGGVLMDNGPHAVDLAHLFLGPIRQVRASHGAPPTLQVEETVHLLLRNAGNLVARAHLSWAVSRFDENFLVLYGTEGTIEVGWNASRVRRHEGGIEVFGDGFNAQEAMVAQLSDFLAAARCDGERLMTTGDAFDNVRLVDAAYRALDQDDWLRVPG